MGKIVLFQMENIRKLFPGAKALHGVDLELRTGEVHALLGENGASKSTLIKVLGSIYTVEKGEIFTDGKKATIDGVNAPHNNGISIIHRELILVSYMVVAENTFFGRELSKGPWVSYETMEKETQQLLNTYHASIDAGTLVKDLAIVQQQIMEIVKAASYHSRILVMDEPTSSISDKEVGLLFSTMRELIKKGVGITYIFHKMDELEQICDRVTVLRDGTYVGTERVGGTTRDHLTAMMVGRELTEYYTRDYMEPGRVVLGCENIADRKTVKGANFELRKGKSLVLRGWQAPEEVKP